MYAKNLLSSLPLLRLVVIKYKVERLKYCFAYLFDSRDLNDQYWKYEKCGYHRQEEFDFSFAVDIVFHGFS